MLIRKTAPLRIREQQIARHVQLRGDRGSGLR